MPVRFYQRVTRKIRSLTQGSVSFYSNGQYQQRKGFDDIWSSSGRLVLQKPIARIMMLFIPSLLVLAVVIL